MNYGKRGGWSSSYEVRNNKPSNNSDKSPLLQNDKQECHVTWTEETKPGNKIEKLNNCSHAQIQDSGNTSLLMGSYTQTMVNLTQLSKYEFTNWMEKLMEA